MDKIKCCLCASNKTELISEDKKRKYYICNICKTITVPPQYHLSIEKEKERYDLHTNSNKDEYYIKFLNRIIEPLLNYIKPNSEGLDFGCGPGPILKEQLKPYKINMSEYDLYYKNDKSLLQKKWDFVVTTEVMEHLKNPYTEIELLWELINPKGVLAVMTALVTKDITFSSWYYKGDPTHISFFSKESFIWLSQKLGADVEFFDKDITFLIKR
ncbi:MAG: class I SAM-dependent methyltransferase [Spirochaetaceae bacterium]